MDYIVLITSNKFLFHIVQQVYVYIYSVRYYIDLIPF